MKLPPQQAKVMVLRKKGLTARQIAEQTGLSFQTVRSYIKLIHQKLGIHSAIEMTGAGLPDPHQRGKGRLGFLKLQLATRSRKWCWIWPFIPRHDGYADITVGGKRKPVHRLSYELDKGVTIPERLKACHHCDNPICFNPDHVFPGTQKDNLDDMSRKGRHPHKRRIFKAV